MAMKVLCPRGHTFIVGSHAHQKPGDKLYKCPFCKGYYAQGDLRFVRFVGGGGRTYGWSSDNFFANLWKTWKTKKSSEVV